MINFLHNFIPQSVIFSWGFITLHWYGVFVVSGILTGLLVVTHLAKKYNITSEEVYGLAFYVIISAIVGARIYSVFLDLPYYLQNPVQIAAVWQGGLAIHGGIIGGVLAALVYTYKKRQSFWLWADLTVPGLALGQSIGRWGNYFNQEIFGTPTTAAWGIPIELHNRPLEYLSHQYFHPTFLYESVLNLINFLVLFWLHKKLKLPLGIIFLLYLINYSIIRFSMEFLRTDSAPEVYGIRWPALLSVGLIIVCVYFIVLKFKKSYN